MTSLYGTAQAYNAIADVYLSLAPTDDDRLFGTDVKYSDLARWGIYDGQEEDPVVLNAYFQQRKGSVQSLLSVGSKAAESFKIKLNSNPSTVAGLLASLPDTQLFAGMVEESGWSEYLNGVNENYRVTILAPTNEAIRRALANGSLQSVIPTRDLVKAHTLPFTVEQSQAIHRKLKLYTTLEGFEVYLDGTGEVKKTLNFYKPHDTFNTLTYPKPLDRIDVKQVYYTNNGALWVIDGVFEPLVYVY